MEDRQTVLLSTSDNPYNPFDQFDEWFQFDLEKQYYSNSLLAKFANVSNELSENEYKEEVESAVDRIISLIPNPAPDVQWVKVVQADTNQ